MNWTVISPLHQHSLAQDAETTEVTSEETSSTTEADSTTDDSDGDQLSNQEEEALGTDPYNPDSDLDSISDADEL